MFCHLIDPTILPCCFSGTLLQSSYQQISFCVSVSFFSFFGFKANFVYLLMWFWTCILFPYPLRFFLVYIFSFFSLALGGYFHGVNSLTFGVDIDKVRWLGILQVFYSTKWILVFFYLYLSIIFSSNISNDAIIFSSFKSILEF